MVSNDPRPRKPVFSQGFRPGPTQTGLYSQRGFITKGLIRAVARECSSTVLVMCMCLNS